MENMFEMAIYFSSLKAFCKMIPKNDIFFFPNLEHWVLVAACGIFRGGMWDLQGQHVGSSSLTCSEPRPPELGAWSLSHWTTREVPKRYYFEGTKHSQSQNLTSFLLGKKKSICFGQWVNLL